ncbi:MAG: sigma-70 family RNA polymerase sigma factor [Ruminococcus sp.]|nr:sigma-70 family RNA polymerase sigma factor [Ruminococcus sp.]
MSAVCRYDRYRGVSFSAYAGRCITNSIVSALRRSRNLPMPVGVSDMPPLSQVQDPAGSPDSVVQSRIQTASMICAMVNRLSRREYQVCMLIYSGASYAQAAQKLYISEKSVDNALQRARRKLRAEANEAM